MQVKFSFDKETMRKIAKGFMYSVAVGFIIAGIDFLAKMAGLVHIEDPVLASVYSIVCANIFNIAKEWASGLQRDEYDY